MGVEWKSRGGKKIISRRFSNTGSYVGNPRGYKSSVIATLPGYDPSVDVGSECILQGMNDGCIRPSPIVFGVERCPQLWDDIEAHAKLHGIDMRLHRGDFKTFVPTRKLDLLNLDLMCAGQDWIGKKVVDDIVGKMKSRRSAIAFNLNVQRATSIKNHDVLVDEYFSDQPYWDRIWKHNPQCGVGKLTADQDNNPFTGVRESGFDALTTFMTIHKEMRETDFSYHGCFRYMEKSSPEAGTQFMLTLRYERPK